MLLLYVQLTVQGFPFEPANVEATKAEFVRRAGVAGITSWDQFAIEGEARQKMMDSFEGMLGKLGRLFLRDDSGPFLLGAKASYADFIVGAWLRMMHATLLESDWQQVTRWHNGLFG